MDIVTHKNLQYNFIEPSRLTTRSTTTRYYEANRRFLYSFYYRGPRKINKKLDHYVSTPIMKSMQLLIPGDWVHKAYLKHLVEFLASLIILFDR